jgi:hypothetical protein
MNIEYLQYLQANPEGRSTPEISDKNIGMTEAEIETLEETYNGGEPFPKVLRELLFLAGKYCYVLDYGPFEEQSTIQTRNRSYLASSNLNITRNYFVIDCGNLGDQFDYVYIEGESEDPKVFSAELYLDADIALKDRGVTLKEFINTRIDYVKQGQNPW